MEQNEMVMALTRQTVLICDLFARVQTLEKALADEKSYRKGDLEVLKGHENEIGELRYQVQELLERIKERDARIEELQEELNDFAGECC